MLTLRNLKTDLDMNGEQIFLNELKDYINCGMSKNDLKTLINQRLKEVEAKQCNIANVVEQSEQLKAFNEQMSIDHHWYMPVPEEDIDRFVKSL